jgi:WD40 repeat protein
LFSPEELQFSPDDRRLVGTNNLTLFIADVSTGQVSYPISTSSGVYGPTWSPDGNKLVYFRASFDNTAPPESSGIHVLDLATGVDQPQLVNGQVIYCAQLHCAPDGRVACVQHLPNGNERIIVLDSTLSDFVVAYDPDGFKSITNLQWYWRPSAGVVSLVFYQPVKPAGFYLVNPDGSGLRAFPHIWAFDSVVAPDGQSFVGEGVDPQSYFGILDVQSMDDFSGATRRHLTRYVP